MMTTGAPRLGFIGAGRVATALAAGLARAGYSVSAVASRTAAAARALANAVPGCRAYDAAQGAADHADLVFLTVPDDAIAALAEKIVWRGDHAVVHCSGATGVEALAPAAAAGAQTGGFHPLQTFADPETALAGMQECVVAIEGPAPLARELHRFARALGARPFALPPDARALYHAAGSFAGGFIVTLLHEAVRAWQGFGGTAEDAVAALLPLARGTLRAAAHSGIVGSLAGPIARGDRGTIEKHLEALGALDPRTLALYRAIALRTIPLALAQGTLTTERAEDLVRLLGDAAARADVVDP